jgi:hypothetical protein
MNTPHQNDKVSQLPSAEAIEVAVHACHQQLHEHRQKLISLYELFLRTSSAYYTMCDLNNQSEPTESELLMAMVEFQRRGLLSFSNNSIEQLSKDYVQSLRMLKQIVDVATAVCDRLSMLSSAQRTAQQTVKAAPQLSNTSQPVFQSLDEALEAELNAEG